jgi:hypothetical protein
MAIGNYLIIPIYHFIFDPCTGEVGESVIGNRFNGISYSPRELEVENNPSGMFMSRDDRSAVIDRAELCPR